MSGGNGAIMVDRRRVPEAVIKYCAVCVSLAIHMNFSGPTARDIPDSLEMLQ